MILPQTQEVNTCTAKHAQVQNRSSVSLYRPDNYLNSITCPVTHKHCDCTICTRIFSSPTCKIFATKQNLGLSKFKAFADDKSDIIGYYNLMFRKQDFLLFQHFFQKDLFLKVIKQLSLGLTHYQTTNFRLSN